MTACSPAIEIQSPLLALSPELRLDIYEHLFAMYQNDGGIWFQFGDPDKPLRQAGTNKAWETPVEQRSNTAILRTCRLINEEAEPVLYHSVHVNIRVVGFADPQDVEYEELGYPVEQCAFLRKLSTAALYIDLWGIEDSLKFLQVVIDLVNTLGRDARPPLQLEGLTFTLADEHDEFDPAVERAHARAVTSALMGLQCQRAVKMMVDGGAGRSVHDVESELARLATRLGGELSLLH